MDDSAESRPPHIYDVETNDPGSRLIDRSRMEPEELQQIGRLMGALGHLREAENRLTDASLRFMQLNKTDMQALHYLIAMGNRAEITTPGQIAAHLRISTASTTKLLDRLERAGHITRSTHPSDRRALAINITEETHEAAMNTVGRQQARRFHAAARLSSEERESAIRFLNDMANEISSGIEDWARQD